MGLFSRKQKEPVVHAEVRRWVYVPSDVEAVRTQLVAYSRLHSPKNAETHALRLSTTDGWTRVDLPHTLHPWTFHNVAYWLLDTQGSGDTVVVVSAGSSHHPGYRLVRDPEMPDALCGVDESGEHWTVGVPMNHVVRGDEVPVTDTHIIPDDVAFYTAGSLEVLLEDPGHDLNPTNEANIRSRKRLEHYGYNAF